jgi:hypothetical protein
MKHWLNKKISLLVLSVITSFYVLAQDAKKVDVDISLDKGDNSTWYQQPWVWVVGGAVFILLLVAMLKGSGSKKD